ncbi:hypothetical protein [Phaffia rhodozyma]|uniref:Uncharacterized protein n=1 Tax=Phaffia rhodozyma TaxID=264483 RepID=A0A0F7SXN8_PHARH|nr:hypothetical protein [Phaffia rhodozyma]
MIYFFTTPPTSLTSQIEATHISASTPPHSPPGHSASLPEPAEPTGFRPYKTQPIVCKLSLPSGPQQTQGARRKSFGGEAESSGALWEYVMNGNVLVTSKLIQFNLTTPAAYRRPVSNQPATSIAQPASPPASPPQMNKKRFSFSFGSSSGSAQSPPGATSDNLALEEETDPVTGLRKLRLKSFGNKDAKSATRLHQEGGQTESPPLFDNNARSEGRAGAPPLSFANFMMGSGQKSEQTNQTVGPTDEETFDDRDLAPDESTALRNSRSKSMGGPLVTGSTNEWPLSIGNQPLTYFQVPLSAIPNSSSVSFVQSKNAKGRSSGRAPATVILDVPAGNQSHVMGGESYDGRVRIEWEFGELFSGDPEAQTLQQTIIHLISPHMMSADSMTTTTTTTTTSQGPVQTQGSGSSRISEDRFPHQYKLPPVGSHPAPTSNPLMRRLSLGKTRSRDPKEEEQGASGTTEKKSGWLNVLVNGIGTGSSK